MPHQTSNRYFILQNSVLKKSWFCSFRRLLCGRKGLFAFDANAATDAFLRLRPAGRAPRLFRSEDFRRFVMRIFVTKRYRFLAVRPPRGHNGAVMGVQRGARCKAIRPLLQRRKGLTAERSRLRRTTTDARPFVCGYE